MFPERNSKGKTVSVEASYMPVRQQEMTPAERWRRWGPKLTICLGAISHRDQSIVMVSDRMATIGNRTADNSMHKWYAIHGDWFVEFAGDAGIASQVLQRAIPYLDPARSYSAIDAQAAMERAVADERASVMCAEYGLTTEQLNQLPPEKMRQLVRKTKWPCEFLVGGFDADGSPQLIWVNGEGKARNCDALGYWAVGSGAEEALAAIARRYRNLKQFGTVATMYHMLEARFAAEVEPGVGKDETMAMVLEYRKFPMPVLSFVGIERLRELYTSHNQRYPDGALEAMGEMFEQSFKPLGRRVPPEWKPTQ